jgi:hypothetical protein
LLWSGRIPARHDIFTMVRCSTEPECSQFIGSPISDQTTQTHMSPWGVANSIIRIEILSIKYQVCSYIGGMVFSRTSCIGKNILSLNSRTVNNAVLKNRANRFHSYRFKLKGVLDFTANSRLETLTSGFPPSEEKPAETRRGKSHGNSVEVRGNSVVNDTNDGTPVTNAGIPQVVAAASASVVAAASAMATGSLLDQLRGLGWLYSSMIH